MKTTALVGLVMLVGFACADTASAQEIVRAKKVPTAPGVDGKAESLWDSVP